MARNWRTLSIHEVDGIQAEVRRLKARADWPGWHEVGRRYNVDHDTLRWHCDEAYAEGRRQRAREWRARHPRGKRPREDFFERYGMSPSIRANVGPGREEIAARLAEIPEDTRSLAQQLTGDPIPGDLRRKVKVQVKSIL